MNAGAELARARHRLGLTLECIADQTKIRVETLVAIERNELDSLPILQARAAVAAYAAALGLNPDELGEDRFSLGDFDSELPAGSGPGAGTSANPGAPGDGLPVGSGIAVSLRPSATSSANPDQPRPFSQPPSPLAPTAARSVPPALTASGPLAKARKPIDAFKGEQFLDLPLIIEDAPLANALSTVPLRAAAPPVDPTRAARRSRVSSGMFVLLPLLAAVAGFLSVRSLDRSWPSNVLVSLGQSPDEGVSAIPPESSDRAAEIQSDQAAHARLPDEPATGSRTKGDRKRRVAAPRLAASAEPDREGRPAPVDTGTRREDVTGSWRLTNRVQSAAYQAFKGLTLDYHLRLKQDGHLVTGDGEKRMENGRPTTGPARTPITLEGTLDGRRLALRFTEQGTRRASVGVIVMEMADDGSLRGRFSSDAANARGTSQAARLDSGRE